jgi:hypothetical protein
MEALAMAAIGISHPARSTLLGLHAEPEQKAVPCRADEVITPMALTDCILDRQPGTPSDLAVVGAAGRPTSTGRRFLRQANTE